MNAVRQAYHGWTSCPLSYAVHSNSLLFLPVSVCCDTARAKDGVVADVSVLWHSPSLGVVVDCEETHSSPECNLHGGGGGGGAWVLTGKGQEDKLTGGVSIARLGTCKCGTTWISLIVHWRLELRELRSLTENKYLNICQKDDRHTLRQDERDKDLLLWSASELASEKINAR